VADVLFNVGEHFTLAKQLELVPFVDPEWGAASLMGDIVRHQNHVPVQASTDRCRLVGCGGSA